MRKRNRNGYGLILELLFVCIVSSILMAEAIPMWIEVRLAQQQQDTLQHIRQYGHAVTAVNLCAITQGCVTPAALNAITTWPLTFYPGTITIEGYIWKYGLSCGADSLACLTATPKTNVDGKYAFFIDDTSTVRCLYQTQTLPVAATATTPVCAF